MKNAKLWDIPQLVVGRKLVFDISSPQLRRAGEVLMLEATPTVWIAKIIGAVAGSLISIAYILPKGRREAWLRFAVGVTTGVIFGGTAGVKLFDMLGLMGSVSVVEMALVGAAVCSLSAWWGLGVLRRVAESWAERRFSRSGSASRFSKKDDA